MLPGPGKARADMDDITDHALILRSASEAVLLAKAAVARFLEQSENLIEWDEVPYLDEESHRKLNEAVRLVAAEMRSTAGAAGEALYIEASTGCSPNPESSV